MDGQPIDYAAEYDDRGKDSRFQPDHYIPVSSHPHLAEDPTNFRASHANCNRDSNNHAPDVNLGIPPRVWA